MYLNTETERALVLLIGDTHINSTIALAAPTVALDNGNAWTAGDYPRWIFRQYQELLEGVKAIKAENPDMPLFTIHHGETADNNYHPTTELISLNPVDLEAHAIQLLEPLAALSDYLIVCRGTEAHVGLSSWLDEFVASDLGAVPEPGTGRASWSRFRGIIGGVPIDAGHHPGTGSRREHTMGNEAIRLAHDTVAEYLRINFGLAEAGEPTLPIPRLVTRGHNHFPADSGPISQPARAIVLPAWQLTTTYGHRLGGKVLPVGAALAYLENGRITDVKHFQRYYPIRAHEWSLAEVLNGEQANV